MNTATDQINIDLDEEKKTAEDYLIHYDAYKHQLEARRDEIIEGRPMQDDMPKKDKYAHGDPTFTKTVKLTSKKFMDTVNWLKAVEATRAHFAKADSNHGIFITERYDMGMTPGQIATDLGIVRQTVYDMRADVLVYLLMVHERMEKR